MHFQGYIYIYIYIYIYAHAHGDFVLMGLSPNLLCVVMMVIYLLSHRGGILPDVM